VYKRQLELGLHTVSRPCWNIMEIQPQITVNPGSELSAKHTSKTLCF
jgi:hypothetical protein